MCSTSQARFLNTFVRAQRGRQLTKAEKAAWLEDDRILRGQERSLEDCIQKQFDSLASSWLPVADSMEYREQVQMFHEEYAQLRMDRQTTVHKAKAGSKANVQLLLSDELRCTEALDRQAASMQQDIKCAVSIHVLCPTEFQRCSGASVSAYMYTCNPDSTCSALSGVAGHC